MPLEEIDRLFGGEGVGRDEERKRRVSETFRFHVMLLSDLFFLTVDNEGCWVVSSDRGIVGRMIIT